MLVHVSGRVTDGISYSMHGIIISTNTVPDPCLSSPCDVNADCTREGLLSLDFNCTCINPFTIGDGFNCSGNDVAVVA